MAANVFEQTQTKEVEVSSNQVACTILEHLLPFTDESTLERLQTAFSSDLRPICSDKFSSHILQKMVEVSFLRGSAKLQVAKEEPNVQEGPAKKRRVQEVVLPDEKQYNLTASFEDDHREKCAQFVVKISKFLLNNLEDFVWDSIACHVIRTCLLALGGVFVFKTKEFISSGPAQNRVKHLTADKEVPIVVPADWNEIVLDYASRLQAWPQFPDFPYDELSSGLLQTLFLALRIVDKNELKHLGKKLLNDAFLVEVKPEVNADEVKPKVNEDEVAKATNTEDVKPITDEDIKLVEEKRLIAQLPKVFQSESSIRMLEALLNVAGIKLLTQLYAKLFAGNLCVLGNMRSGNFAVQKLLDNCKTKEDFEAIFDEIAPSLEDLLRIGHTGVVSALAQACLRLSAKQGAFVTAIQSALHCTAPKERFERLSVLTMKLKPFEVAANDKSNFVHLHGSLILQAMLRFNKPIKLVQSLLDTKPTELADLFANARGSHVVDAFIDSKFIGEKSREKFIKHMNGTFLDLAISTHGSRAVEAMFAASGDNQKTRIVKELSEKLNQLKGCPSGRLLNYKFHVETYALSPTTWKASFNKETKVQKLFKDII